jgi:hypothetical protein
MADKEVKIVLTAEDNVSSVINKVTEKLGQNGLGESITAVSTSFLALKGAAEVVIGAFQKINDVLQAGINDAAQAEMVNKRLAMSLANVGTYSNEALIAVNDWAGALETVTGISDENIRSQVSLGLQFGMTTEQAKKATEAAINLAAATGQDMETAFKQIGMTLDGAAGRMGKIIPELRNLTKEELMNGGAIDVIAKKYDGFANQTANTYIGAQKQIEAQIGNVKEAFGRLIAQNPAYIASMQSKAEMLREISAAVDKFSTFLLNNGDDIKLFAESLAAAGVAVGAYLVYINFATISTMAFSAAAWTAAGAMAILTSPVTLTIAAIVALGTAFYFLIKNIDLVVGALKFGLGKALEWVMVPLGMYIDAIGTVVGVFNKEWGKSLSDAAASIRTFSKELQDAGQAQMDLAKNSKAAGKELDQNALIAQRAAAGLAAKIAEAAQEVQRLRVGFGKAMEGAQAAFAGLKDLSPRMSLDMFNTDAKAWTKSIEDLKKYGGDLKLKLALQPQDAMIKSELAKINEQVSYAEEATKALKIKIAQETRGAITKEEEIRLSQVKDKELSVANEIMMMRVDNAKAIRDRQIAIETERIMTSRGLASQDAQAGVTIKEQAWMDANQREMAAFTAHLELQKQTAIGIESQKQLALAQVKADAMSGTTAGGMQAKNDVEMIQAEQKAAQLKVLRDNDKLSETDYQNELTAIRINAMSSRTAMEVALNEQRIQALGQTPDALALQLENNRIQTEGEMLILQEKYATQQLTEEEFNAGALARSEEMAARQNEIKEAYLQKDVEKNQRLRDAWGTTLAQIRLEQEKHGQVMGTIQGIYNSEQMKGLQTGLGNAASLMQSSNASQFRIGQQAAIAQAAINIPLSAINAYTSMSSIPFIGPALGIAAAAAAIAAGAMNISKIRSQKPPGSAAHGGIDEIPKSMDNSTFLLKAGERVVQPGQNAELGKAIEKINSGNGGGGNSVSVVIQGNADDAVVDRMVVKIMDALREKSERGVPVINSRGIVNA